MQFCDWLNSYELLEEQRVGLHKEIVHWGMKFTTYLSDIACSQRMINGVDTLKGRLPMMCMCGGWSSHFLLLFSENILLMSKFITSPRITCMRWSDDSSKSWKEVQILQQC